MKKIFRAVCAAFFFLLLFAAFLNGCGKAKEKLVVGTEAGFPPYGYLRDNKITGIDPEIMTVVAERLGREAVFAEMNFDSLLEAVSSGRIDVAASAISIDEARKDIVSFTEPYDSTELVVVLPLRSPVKNFSDLKNKMVGVLRSSSADTFVTRNAGFPSRFSNMEMAFQDLLDGKIDAVVTDSGPAKLAVLRSKKLKMLKTPLARENYAFAVRKDRKDLLDELNGVIRELKTSGRLDAIKKKHWEYSSAWREEKNTEKRIFKIAIDPTFPPIGYIRDGKPAGIEIDLLDRIAKELDRTPVYEQVGFDALFEIVKSDNDVSVGAGSISITEERKKIISFTIPYFKTRQYLYVRKDSPYTSLKDLAGKRVGAIYCTTAETYLKKHFGGPDCFSEAALLFQALSSGEIDAAMMDSDPAEVFMRKNGNLKQLPEVLLEEEYGFAVRKEDKELLEQINDVLLRFQEDGTLRRIRDKHFQLFGETSRNTAGTAPSGVPEEAPRQD